MGELGIPRAMCIDGEVGLLVRLKGSGKTGGNLLVVADVRVKYASARERYKWSLLEVIPRCDGNMRTNTAWSLAVLCYIFPARKH